MGSVVPTDTTGFRLSGRHTPVHELVSGLRLLLTDLDHGAFHAVKNVQAEKQRRSTISCRGTPVYPIGLTPKERETLKNARMKPADQCFLDRDGV